MALGFFFCYTQLHNGSGADADLSKQAFVTGQTASAKNRRTETLPLRSDLAAELRAWKPAEATIHDRVFNVPKNLLRMLKKDLAAAGSPYEDDAGRTLNVHALRTLSGRT